MKVLYSWLQDHVDAPLPDVSLIEQKLIMHAFEVESVEKISDTDAVLDVKIIPDRAHDALSHRGIAREIAALFDLPRKEKVYTDDTHTVSPQIPIHVKDIALCPNFGTIEIHNICIAPSPAWLVQRLEALGQRSINNVVDATNFVMLDMGKPMHAFDLNKIDGELIVRRSIPGESLITLDNKQVEFTGDELVIADGSHALSIAGIKGGKQAEVDTHTTSIVLESANFKGSAIRKTSQKVGIKTDASKRFESEITSEWTRESLRACADLIVSIAGTPDTQVSSIQEIYEKKEKKYTVGVSVKEVNSLLGLSLTTLDIEKIFTRKHFEYTRVIPQSACKALGNSLIGVPYKRGSSVLFDSPLSFDCSSLTAYIYAQAGFSIPRIAIDQYVYGYERVGVTQIGDLVFANTGIIKTSTGSHYSQVLERDIPESAIRYESVEWMPGTAVPAGVDHVGIYLGDDMVLHATSSIGKVVCEKLSESESFKHKVGVRYIAKDLNEERIVVQVPFERKDIRIKEDLIDEIGRMVGGDALQETTHYENIPMGEIHKRLYYGNIVRNILTDNGFNEIMSYSFAEAGDIAIVNSVDPKRNKMRTTLTPGVRDGLQKGLYYGPLLALTTINVFEIGNIFTEKDERTHLAIGIYTKNKKEKKEVENVLQNVCTQIEQKLGVSFTDKKIENNDGLCIVECDFDTVLEQLPVTRSYEKLIHIPKRDLTYTSLSIYPFIVRDIAIFVPSGTDESVLLQDIIQVGGRLVVRAYQFDKYQKDEQSPISLGYRIVFQSFERTLLDSEVEAIMEHIYTYLKGKGYEVR